MGGLFNEILADEKGKVINSMAITRGRGIDFAYDTNKLVITDDVISVCCAR